MFKCEEKLLTTAVLKLILLHDPWPSSAGQIVYQNQSLYILYCIYVYHTRDNVHPAGCYLRINPDRVIWTLTRSGYLPH